MGVHSSLETNNVGVDSAGGTPGSSPSDFLNDVSRLFNDSPASPLPNPGGSNLGVPRAQVGPDGISISSGNQGLLGSQIESAFDTQLKQASSLGSN